MTPNSSLFRSLVPFYLLPSECSMLTDGWSFWLALCCKFHLINFRSFSADADMLFLLYILCRFTSLRTFILFLCYMDPVYLSKWMWITTTKRKNWTTKNSSRNRSLPKIICHTVAAFPKAYSKKWETTKDKRNANVVCIYTIQLTNGNL